MCFHVLALHLWEEDGHWVSACTQAHVHWSADLSFGRGDVISPEARLLRELQLHEGCRFSRHFHWHQLSSPNMEQMQGCKQHQAAMAGHAARTMMLPFLEGCVTMPYIKPPGAASVVSLVQRHS